MIIEINKYSSIIFTLNTEMEISIIIFSHAISNQYT